MIAWFRPTLRMREKARSVSASVALPREQGGGYYKDKVIATFAAMFPAHDPKYVLIVTLDEPVETSGSKPRRTAGWTAVPVAAEMIGRIAPLLGLRPDYDMGEVAEVTLVRQ